MDYARLRLLGFLAEHEDATATVANEFGELDKWLDGANLLMTYVAGPIPNTEQHATLRAWLEAGGRWFALHGTSGGRAARIEGTRQRKWVRSERRTSASTPMKYSMNSATVNRLSRRSATQGRSDLAIR